MRATAILTVVIHACISICLADAPASKDHIGDKLQDVTLAGLKGETVKLLELHKGKALVLCYTGVGCPISGKYAPRLEEMSKKFAKDGVQFVGINANPQDSAEKIAKEITALGVTFPVLRDEKQTLTNQIEARTTTEVFLIDKDHVIRYRGAIDDQFALGAQKDQPKELYLTAAIRALLAGKKPPETRTAAPGCVISRTKHSAPDAAESNVTYSSHIAKILADNCQSCHRAGGVGPFALTTFEEASGWSAMIREVVNAGVMPPWNADKEFDGHFSNERKLSETDRKALLAWVESGMPRGTPADDPPAKEWTKNWRIGEPDKIFAMKEAYSVPKEGVVPYQYFQIPTNFKEDKWVTAVEARAGSPGVVHHILAFAIPGREKPEDDNAAGRSPRGRQGEGGGSGRNRRAQEDHSDAPSGTSDRLGLDDGFLAATVPGDTPSHFPAGTGKKIPAGSTLVLQMHYTPNGKPAKDRSSVGLVFADKPPEREVITRGIYNMNFEIPAGAANHEVKADYTFDRDIELLAFFPHMHYRGKSFEYVAHLPDGKAQPLLKVSQYDFNWQEAYTLKTPVSLPKGTRIECIAHFDNSSANPNNPDPGSPVRWGEQTFEEMMIGYVEFVEKK